MSLALANPWFLLGLLALGIPVLVHLVARRDEAGRAFPSLMFVRRIPLERRRRRTLRDPWLLALRCVVLALLAGAFALPYLIEAADARAVPGAAQTVFVLDASHSMHHDGRWTRALQRARRAIDALAPGARAALVSFSDHPRALVPLTGEHARLRAALDAAASGNGGTDFARALAHAADQFDRTTPGSKRILLISDLQRSGLRPDQAPTLPADVHLEIDGIGASAAAGAVLTGVEVDAGTSQAARVTLAAHVLRHGEAAQGALLRARVDGHLVAERALTEAELAAGTAALSVVPDRERASQVVVTLNSATETTHALSLARVAPIRVVLVADNTRQAAFFLTRALALARRPAVALRQTTANAIGAELLAPADVLIMTSFDGLDAGGAARVGEFASRGGGVLVAAPGPGADAAPRARWAAMDFLPGRSRNIVSGNVRIVDSDTGHPAFADLTAIDLAGAEVWRRLDLEAGDTDRVIARFTDGAPAMLERRHGSGATIRLATAIDSGWNALALEPGFPVLVNALARYLAGRHDLTGVSAVTAGNAVDLREYASALGAGRLARHLAAGGKILVESPSGGVTPVVAGSAVFVPHEVGFHQLHLAGIKESAVPLAVNVAARELEPALLDARELRAAIVTAPPARQVSAPPGRDNAGREQGWWWYLIAITATLCLLEGLLAARRSQQAAPVLRTSGGLP